MREAPDEEPESLARARIERVTERRRSCRLFTDTGFPKGEFRRPLHRQSSDG
jgi:hypothetical protein